MAQKLKPMNGIRRVSVIYLHSREIRDRDELVRKVRAFTPGKNDIGMTVESSEDEEYVFTRIESGPKSRSENVVRGLYNLYAGHSFNDEAHEARFTEPRAA